MNVARMLSVLGIIGFSVPLSGCDSSSDDTGAGGAAGSGGSVRSPLIDDMEDGDNEILLSGGRIGYWFIANDETPAGTQLPAAADMPMTAIDPPREGSSFGANSSGSGFTEWGAEFGFDLNNASGEAGAYDASTYTGIRFFARVGPGSVPNVRVNVADVHTVPQGGFCNEAANECYDHFGSTLLLGQDWQPIELAFADLTQEDFGTPAPEGLQRDQLYGIYFGLEANVTFDVWIDDVSFVE